MRTDAVLCPTDFSPCAARGVEMAAELAASLKARLVLLTVVSDPPIELVESTVLGTALRDRFTAASNDLGRLAEMHERANSTVQRRVEEGDPTLAILRVAKQEDADLIVMGTHGRGAFGRAILGSVADRVIRQAICPVVAVGPEEPHGARKKTRVPGRFRTILIATDFSEQALEAAQVGLLIAKAQSSRVSLLHVQPDLSGFLPGAGATSEVKRQVGDEKGLARLDALKHRLLGEAPAEVRLRRGDTATEILACAEEVEADLIVCGTHGRSGLPRLLLGSVTERLIRLAPVPVLVVRPATVPAVTEGQPQ